MEAPAIVDLGPRLLPAAIRHTRLGLSWTVLAVLEDWTTPHYYSAVGTSAETKRFRVRVSGPLPGNPVLTGEFVMLVKRYGDRPGWWASPEEVISGLRTVKKPMRRRPPERLPWRPTSVRGFAARQCGNVGIMSQNAW
jgi:hypothetical protein